MICFHSVTLLPSPALAQPRLPMRERPRGPKADLLQSFRRAGVRSG
ncbi:MAG: hypothetical protein M0Q43_10990 [Methanothrix sp.]|nr:hypothetical protein [Methanothrix sp.]